MCSVVELNPQSIAQEVSDKHNAILEEKEKEKALERIHQNTEILLGMSHSSELRPSHPKAST